METTNSGYQANVHRCLCNWQQKAARATMVCRLTSCRNPMTSVEKRMWPMYPTAQMARLDTQKTRRRMVQPSEDNLPTSAAKPDNHKNNETCTRTQNMLTADLYILLTVTCTIMPGDLHIIAHAVVRTLYFYFQPTNIKSHALKIE